MADIYEDSPKAGTVAKDRPACSGETTVCPVSGLYPQGEPRFPIPMAIWEKFFPGVASNAATSTAPVCAASHHNEDSGPFIPPCGCDDCWLVSVFLKEAEPLAARHVRAGYAAAPHASPRRR